MIISIFRSVSDHWVVSRCLYRLDDLLTIALLAYLCGSEDSRRWTCISRKNVPLCGFLKKMKSGCKIWTGKSYYI